MARRGRLSVNPLPAALQAPLWLDAVAFHARLEDAFDAVVDLTLTDNRRSLIHIQRAESGRFAVRLHHMFAVEEEPILYALADLGLQPSEARVAAARARLRAFAEDNEGRIRRKTPARRVRLRPHGLTYDLRRILAATVRDHFEPRQVEGVEITWGRWGRLDTPTREIRLGSYDPRRRLIRIHPLLDRPQIPEWIVAFIVYHELLHHLIPTRREGGRLIHHGPDFRQREALHPRFEDYRAWAELELGALLSRVARGEEG